MRTIQTEVPEQFYKKAGVLVNELTQNVAVKGGPNSLMIPPGF